MEEKERKERKQNGKQTKIIKKVIETTKFATQFAVADIVVILPRKCSGLISNIALVSKLRWRTQHTRFQRNFNFFGLNEVFQATQNGLGQESATLNSRQTFSRFPICKIQVKYFLNFFSFSEFDHLRLCNLR